MKATMIDVAKAAGVLLTAVSFAFNGQKGISAETKKKILEAAKALGYTHRETEASKQVRRNRSKTILLLNGSRSPITRNIFPSTPYFSELLNAFDMKLSAMGYRFSVETLLVDDYFESNLQQTLHNTNVNAILLVATDMLEEDIRIVLRNEPNTVVLDACFDGLEANCIVMDNYLGGVLAAKKAISSGHRDIGYLQSETRIYNFDQRKRGFMEALHSVGLSVARHNLFSAEPSIHTTTEQLSSLLRSRQSLPTFFFAENDYLAIALIKTLRLQGIQVPSEVSVIGFDNIEAASITTPQLSTINVPKEKLAEFCVRQLSHLLRCSTSVKIKHLIAVDLIDRETVCPVSST